MMFRTVFSRGVLIGTFAWALGACSDPERAPGDGGSLVDRRPIPGKCTIPAEGCPCSTDLVVKCGETVQRDEDTLTCRTGERTCVDGSWSACAGTKKTQVYASRPTPPGVQAQALASAPVDCNDACDPYCQSLADTPEDAVLDDGLTIDMDGGLTLTEPGFTSSNCPEIEVAPEEATLTITTINDDGTISPHTVELDAICAVGGAEINPSWSIDESDRAMIDGDGNVRVFSAIAGELNVTAQSQVMAGTGVVNVVVDVAAQTGAATPAVFNAVSNTPDPGKTLYPYRETVFPLDLKAPLVQWQTGGTAASQVQISLRYPAGSMAPTFRYVHTVLGEPTQGNLETTGAPAWQVPQEVWTAFGRSAAGATGEIVVQRYAGGTLYDAMVIPVRFATEALRGTVYYTQYLRRLLKPGAEPLCEDSQADLPESYNALSPGAVCPVGNCTHALDVSGGSTTRAIDMSNPKAENLDPFENAGGCPVCHSVSAHGNVYVAGSRFLQTYSGGTSTGFVNSIIASEDGSSAFSVVGEAGNYARYRSETDWDSRGFSYAPLTPDGSLALQGYYYWGNTRDVDVPDNNTVALGLLDGNQQSAMFFVPTANPGPSVLYATTAALSATLNTATNELTANAGGVLPAIDGYNLAVNDSLLVKNQVDARQNGIYVVTDLGVAPGGSNNLTTSTTLTATASSIIGAGSPASRAFDNDYNTRWESQWSDPQWLQVDLGSTQSVSRVVIDWEAASARTYTVQVSTNNVNWTTVVTVANNTNYPQHRWDDQTFAAVNARYVRVNGTARNQSYGYSIWEMDVYGGGSGTPYKLTRRSDAVTPPTANGSLTAGAEVRVRRGNANYGHVFRLTSHPTTAPNVNVDALTFTDINATPLTWPMMTATISPDGAKLAYINGDSDPIGANTTAWRKGVTMMDFDQSTRTLTNKKRILNNAGAGSNNTFKWPFFEHDSRSLIVQESNTSSFCSSAAANTDVWRACKDSRYGGTAPTNRGFWPGRLHSVDTAAANPATTKAELSRLNDAEDPADADKAYQPTVLPFESGGYRWVVFTSPRSYGNQINQIGTHFTCGATMLWVAALDDETASATDRSHPAFFLPGQNVARIRGQTLDNPDHFVNERGYLVPSPCKQNGLSCATSDECCEGNCAIESVPMSGPPARVCKAVDACSAVGDACLSNADCCGGSPCVGSTCQVEPTYTAPATFTRVFEAECPAGFHPLWGLFLYHLTTPSSSHIEFAAETADDLADLEMAETVVLGDSQADNAGMPPATFDVGEELLDAQVSPSLSLLRVHMILHPAADGSVAPVLHDWEQRYSCVPAE